MTLQLIRDKYGKLRGIAFLRGNAIIVSMAEPPRKAYAICEICFGQEAVLFCTTHQRYVCETCIAQSPAHRHCQFMDVTRAAFYRPAKYQESA